MNDSANWQVGEVLSQAWDLTKSNIGLILGALVVMVAITGVAYGIFYGLGVASMFALSESAAGPILMSVFMFLGFIVLACCNLYFSLNIIRLFLKIVRGQGAAFGDLFGGTKGMGSLILASILIGIASSLGSIVVVGGLVVGLFCFFATMLIADKGLGPIEAIKESVNMVKDRWLDILIWMLVVVGVNLVGALACGLGQIVTAPITALGSLIIYDRIVGGGVAAPGMPAAGGGMPPQGGGYPPQGGGYPPQGGGYPPQGGGYPPQGGGY